MKGLEFLIIILNFLSLSSSQEMASEYICSKNVNLISNIHNSKLIASYKIIKRKYSCLRECNKNHVCLSCSFDTLTLDCLLYNFTSDTIDDYTFSNTGAIFAKRGIKTQQSANFSLLIYFKNSVLKSSIKTWNGVNFSFAMSTDMAIDNGTVFYYTVDYNISQIIKTNSTWNYVANVTIMLPRIIKWAKSFLYLSSDNGLFKLDYNLNILNSINDVGSNYNGIYYNLTDDTIITCVWLRQRIDIFDLSLNLIGNISLGSFCPMGIYGFEGSLYVSAYSQGTLIFIIKNRKIIGNISIITSGTNYINTILIDDYGYMALTFRDGKAVRLYHINGSNIGLSISIPNKVYHISYGLNKNLMASAFNGIYFY